MANFVGWREHEQEKAKEPIRMMLASCSCGWELWLDRTPANERDAVRRAEVHRARHAA